MARLLGVVTGEDVRSDPLQAIQHCEGWGVQNDSLSAALAIRRFIYALKEIRACLEAELLTDVQQRVMLILREMENHNGQRVFHQPTFPRG